MRREANLWRFPFVAPAAIAGLAFLYVPIITLIIMSFNEGDSLTIWSGFGFRWYGVVLGNNDMLRAIRNSLAIGGTATAIGTTVATIAAIGLALGGLRRASVIEQLIALPLVLPEIVVAISMLVFFVLIGFPLGMLSVVVAHSTFTIPFAFLPIRARLADMDRSLFEAATDLYANRWQATRRIVIPLLLPGILAGAMLAFIASLGDFVISFFVSGPGTTTLPVYIFGMIKMGITPTVNAISTLLIVVSILILALAYPLGRWFR
jgi:spermidine/putrescine transport system permease protein